MNTLTAVAVAVSTYLSPIASSTSSQLQGNKETIQGVVTNFSIANQVDVKSFRYGEFNQAMDTLHPALLWATLRYLNDRSTGARKDHVATYLQSPYYTEMLNRKLAVAQQPQTTKALELFEQLAATSPLKDTSERSFLKIIDRLIGELRTKRI